MCIYISLYDGTCHAASTGKCGWGAKKYESIPDGQVFAICVWPRAKIGVLQVTLSLTLYLFLS